MYEMLIGKIHILHFVFLVWKDQWADNNLWLNDSL